MLIECGPDHDKRFLNFTLPVYFDPASPTLSKMFFAAKGMRKNHRIGILVSGGIDSALLYFLLLKENHLLGNPYTITPYTILRKEGSRNYALKVINHINTIVGLPQQELSIVGNNTLPEIQQVDSGVMEIQLSNDFVYVGVIESREEHSIGWYRHNFQESERIKYPLRNLQKSHVIDLIYQFNIESVLPLTHSCAIDEINLCGYCNGCHERVWGFTEIGKIDPRSIVQ